MKGKNKDRFTHGASYSESVSMTLIASAFIMVMLLACVGAVWLVLNDSFSSALGEDDADSMPNRYQTVSGSITDSCGRILASTDVPSGSDAARTRIYNEAYTRAVNPLVGYINAGSGEGADGVEAKHRQWLKFGSGLDETYGGSIRLTVDAELQKELYDLMLSSDLYENAAISCIDANTGRIVALTDIPSCSQNTMSDSSKDPQDYVENCLAPGAQLAQAYESRAYHGSCFKLATAVVLANEEELRTDDGGYIRDLTVDASSGTFSVMGVPVKASAPSDGQSIDLPRAIAFSHNYYFSTTAAVMGAGRMEQQYEKLFLLREPIECDFGTIYRCAYDFSDESKFVKGVYGEGDMRISNLRMTMITAAIASDDGSYLRPYCIDTYIDNDGVTERGDIYRGKRDVLTENAVSKTARELILNGMSMAAQRYSIGDNGVLGGVKIYAKTGTATSGANKNNIAVTCAFSANGTTYAMTLTAFDVPYSGSHGAQGADLIPEVEKAIEAIISHEAAQSA